VWSGFRLRDGLSSLFVGDTKLLSIALYSCPDCGRIELFHPDAAE